MNYAAIIDSIVEIESRFPVSNWTIDGLRVWPLIRIKLYALLSARSDESGNDADTLLKSADVRQSRWTGALRALKRAALLPLTIFRARKVQSRLSSSPSALFYSLSHMRTRVDGHWYDRHCDPIIDILADEYRIQSLLLESAYEIPHRSPRAHEAASLEMGSWTWWYGRSAARKGAVTMERYPEFLESMGNLRRDLEIDQFQKSVASIRAMREAFKSAFARTRPDVCFVACYFHAPAMALAWACRDLGVECVDVQHGMRTTPAYSRWTAVPPGGYELLPSVFWNWTESESVAVQEWTQATRGAHRAIVGGYPWLDLFSSMELPSQAGNGQSGLVILFSMPTFEWELPEWIVRTVAASPAEWTWKFRLHPRQQEARHKLKSTLAASGTSATYEVDEASDNPLPVLLRHTDVHVTHSSSVIIEAEYFGIRSVAIQPDAARSYPNQASSGVLVTAVDGETLLAAISSQAGKRDSSKLSVSSKKTREALDSLLKPAGLENRV